MTPFIIMNLLMFLVCVCIFAICDYFGKIFWTLVFCIFTYFNVTKFYPEYIERQNQERISQEKLKNCDILRPNDRIVVYHCPEYTTTVNSIHVGRGVRTETVTINNK